jgi:sarcosine oxidase, subunit beta
MTSGGNHSADVVIIGAGVLGLSSGWWLARQGSKVIVLEKGQAGYEASSRATGYHSMRGENPPEIPLASAANELWLTLDRDLGYPTEWLSGGRLWITLDQHELDDLSTACRHWQASGLPVRMIDAAEARKMAPCLSEHILGGMHTTRGGHANPQRTTQAFAWAFQDHGGIILENTPALEILTTNGRISGVRTPSGTIFTEQVVCCAGPQTAVLARQVGIEVPIATARLEGMVTTPLPPQFTVAMVGHGLSMRQTRRGNLHFNGGPHEWVDVDLTSQPAKPNTPVIRGCARRLTEAFPSLASTPLLRSWAGIVEVTPDHATVIEKADSPQGFIVVSGSGHGIGLSPAIGKVVSELVRDGKSSIPIQGLGLDRFANLEPNWKSARQWTAGSYNT